MNLYLCCKMGDKKFFKKLFTELYFFSVVWTIGCLFKNICYIFPPVIMMNSGQRLSVSALTFQQPSFQGPSSSRQASSHSDAGWSSLWTGSFWTSPLSRPVAFLLLPFVAWLLADEQRIWTVAEMMWNTGTKRWTLPASSLPSRVSPALLLPLLFLASSWVFSLRSSSLLFDRSNLPSLSSVFVQLSLLLDIQVLLQGSAVKRVA